MSDSRGSASREPKPASGRTWLDRIGQALAAEPQDRAALVAMLRDSERRGLIDADALAMTEGALQVGDLQVRDIMVPRAQMVVIEEDVAPEDFVAAVIESGHSRFPIIGDSRDEVHGILLAKDLLAYFSSDKKGTLDLDDLMRPAVIVPESKRLNVLLREFRQSRNHMAIVVDEYGGIAGLVTIEDVLEQIVGEIDDEHDIEEDRQIRCLERGEHMVKARTSIEDFNEYFHTHYDDEAFDTIGGLVIKAFGRLPVRGETCEIEGVSFKVVRADKRRVHLLRVLDTHTGGAPGTVAE
ncbi:MAG: HlyC/CorC family transporter [Gammaproteobacteria bacterium]